MPTALVVTMESANLMQVNSVQGNSDLKLSTSGGGVARGREDGAWDDDY